MIPLDLAEALQLAGVRWTPRSGDQFAIPKPGLEDQVFTVSELTIEPREYPTGTILAFNGTTEWALDSVAQDETLWLPREDQLRELLGGTFNSMVRAGADFAVTVDLPGQGERQFAGETPSLCYGRALLALLGAVIG
jgi:hypothetical protein